MKGKTNPGLHLHHNYEWLGAALSRVLQNQVNKWLRLRRGTAAVYFTCKSSVFPCNGEGPPANYGPFISNTQLGGERLATRHLVVKTGCKYTRCAMASGLQRFVVVLPSQELSMWHGGRGCAVMRIHGGQGREEWGYVEGEENRPTYRRCEWTGRGQDCETETETEKEILPQQDLTPKTLLSTVWGC